MLKAEAIVSPDMLVQYLGAHDRWEPECDLAYDNQLMVMLWSALATRDDGLRYALVCGALVNLWAAAHYFIGSRRLKFTPRSNSTLCDGIRIVPQGILNSAVQPQAAFSPATSAPAPPTALSTSQCRSASDRSQGRTE